VSTLEHGGPAFPIPPVGTGDPRDGMAGGSSGMTLREYAAIHLRVPDSGTRWLDDMIRSSLGEEFAKTALQGVLAARVRGESTLNPDSVAEAAYRYSDAMRYERWSKNGGAT
jgi:hypothetical protein